MANETSRKDRLKIAIRCYLDNIYILKTQKYSWMQALRDAGYSHNYAKSKCSGLWARAESEINKQAAEYLKKQENKAKWDLEKISEEYRDLYNISRNRGDNSNAKGCLDSLTRMQGGFTDNIASKNTNINKSEISDAERDLVAQTSRELKVKIANN